MITYQVGDITLEEFKPREWRAWRRLGENVPLETGDEIQLNGSWVLANWTRRGIGEHYRRPVPLPSIGELAEVASIPEGVFKIAPSHQDVCAWLRDLLPGYEEQLAKEHGDYLTPEEEQELESCPEVPISSEEINTLVSIVVSENPSAVIMEMTHRCYDALETGKPITARQRAELKQCLVQLRSRVREGWQENEKPSPVPADGWRPWHHSVKYVTRVKKMPVDRWVDRDEFDTEEEARADLAFVVPLLPSLKCHIVRREVTEHVLEPLPPPPTKEN